MIFDAIGDFCFAVRMSNLNIFQFSRHSELYKAFPALGLQQQTHCCRLADVGLAGRKISIACCSSGRQMQAVPRCQHTWVAEHRLAFM